VREKLSSNPELQRLAGQIGIVITEEGMRLELLEADEGERVFEVGGATLRPGAARVLRVIAQSLASLPNNIVIEGHTDARSYGPSAAYTNWELSADRANAARRQLLAGGVPVSRVVEVRGYADRALRLPSSPYDAANRRVSILLPFNMPMIQEGSMEEAARRVAAGASADDPDVLGIPVDMTDVLGCRSMRRFSSNTPRDRGSTSRADRRRVINTAGASTEQTHRTIARVVDAPSTTRVAVDATSAS